MQTNRNTLKWALALALLLPLAATAQTSPNSTPSPVPDCGSYQWPEVQSPCPEVQIKQKHDHTPLPQYRREGWDTVITCANRQIILSCMPYIPVQYTNGNYYVDVIPYNPPDPTFSLGTRMPLTADDEFAPNYTTIPFPFYFFGLRKNQFRLGANGMVTFCSPNNFGNGVWCEYNFRTASNQLPWTTNTPGGSNYFNRMHDAIYGVYEDTDPRYFDGTSNTDTVDGIFYGVQDEYPCRKIICSWKKAPDFGQNSQKSTYQIVCYEGSNIIEVHVKRRSCCPSTSDALIGIQNATGQPQTKSDDPNNPLFNITAGAPAAFWPVGRNGFTSTIDTTAYRFTPRGVTFMNSKWYRILPDTTIELTQNPNDTNGYCTPMGTAIGSCPNLTLAYVSPTTVSKYYYSLRFKNANGDWYDLCDTITIGIDTNNDLSFQPLQQDICLGDAFAPSLQFKSIKSVEHANWYISRISGGDTIPLDISSINIGSVVPGDINNSISVEINSTTLPDTGRRDNKIDSILIASSIDFVGACHGDALHLLRIFPNFDTTITAGICRGETYRWSTDGNAYTETTTRPYPSVNLHSQPGCDSIVRLNLTVYDVSHTIDHIEDCKPITWINGKTYSQDNTATFDRDTVILANRYNCDSIVQLDFTIHPLTAKIHASLDHFSYDNLDVVLQDISIGGNRRTWKLPNSPDQNTSTAYYTAPVSIDTATILLIESSEYGCVDTATLALPFYKETFWVPNAFTPDNPAGNSIFGSKSVKTLSQEMLIYNRFGELIFRCDQPDCGWDGRTLDGEPCPQGAYVYIIRYNNEFEPNKTHVKKGTVTLLR